MARTRPAGIASNLEGVFFNSLVISAEVKHHTFVDLYTSRASVASRITGEADALECPTG